jgi:hypothetical protein
LGTGNAKSETEKRSVAPLFVEEKRKKTHKISRFWVLLLLRSLKKPKVQQKYNSFTNTASILNLIIAVKMKLKIGNNRE